jgi:hypothetical protein
MPASSSTAQVFPILHARIKSPTWWCQNLPSIRVVYTVPNHADASVLRPVSRKFAESVTHLRRLAADRTVLPGLLLRRRVRRRATGGGDRTRRRVLHGLQRFRRPPSAPTTRVLMEGSLASNQV